MRLKSSIAKILKNMARPRKSTFKDFNLGNYFLRIDTYKKKVGYFHLRFNVSIKLKKSIVIGDDSPLHQSAYKLMKQIARDEDIIDVIIPTKFFTTTKQSHIEFSLYSKIGNYDDFEEITMRKVKWLIPQIERLFADFGFQIVKK